MRQAAERTRCYASANERFSALLFVSVLDALHAFHSRHVVGGTGRYGIHVRSGLSHLFEFGRARDAGRRGRTRLNTTFQFFLTRDTWRRCCSLFDLQRVLWNSRRLVCRRLDRLWIKSLGQIRRVKIRLYGRVAVDVRVS